jgi:predicted nucleic acid-binding protein
MIVVDASAALAALLNDGQARRVVGGERLQTPHLIDSEIASGLRRQVRMKRVPVTDAWDALNTWRHLAMTRYPVYGLLERIWDLRDNVSVYDASYIALAEILDCTLVTADARLSHAAGVRCAITLVRK